MTGYSWEALQGRMAVKGAIIGFILLGGWLLAGFVSKALSRLATKHLDVHRAFLVRRISFYLILVLSFVTALNEAGINLSVVVGAAGVASVAIGFASQTSMSNLISGIFVVIEKPFMVGDTIRIGTTTGDVSSMGLLSTILKTPDNIMVRIPNENLMKSEIFNVTRYPLRRFDLPLSLSYGADLDRARQVLLEVAFQHALALKEPGPSVTFRDYGLASINITFSVWVKTVNFGEASYQISVLVKAALDRAGIDLAVPTRSPSLVT
ncbi:MAG: mechanosensitive ion channel family protein [Proteobacteria bacterium]|nr:mechanosensitive ion channel family protein [Pseudomonadota bacterium]